MSFTRRLRRALPVLLVSAACLGAPAPAAARTLTVATWNLGWHMDRALAQRWMQACGQPFALDAASSLWRPAAQGTRGWELKWGRNAPIEWDIARLPPCDVYQAGFRAVEVTPQAWETRLRQIGTVLRERVAADVIAFQEVSGRQAVLDVLPDGGRDYEVCSYEGHKVQRLAIAWRRALGPAQACEAYWPLSLPQRPAAEQPRPGLALTLRLDGRSVKVLTLHLKSSCVSPIETSRSVPGRGRLDGDEPNCLVLHDQIAPLEAWIEAQTAQADALVLLGDFNRNLAQEDAEPAQAGVRSRGRASDPHEPGVRIRNLWREVNDGVPATSRLELLKATCDAAVDPSGACAASAQRALAREELEQLRSPAALGCRNPLGLDHIVLAGAAGPAGPARKVALGAFGRTSAATAEGRPALLAVSDHCPLVAPVELR